MSFLDHSGDDSLCADEWANEVDVDNLTEVFDVHFSHRNALDDACIVYEDIDSADVFFDVGNHSLNFFFFGYVAKIAFSVDACFLIVGIAHVDT